MKNNIELPFVVDLDGTLLKTDLPFESFVFVMTHHPFKLVQISAQTFWLKIRGKPASFKQALQKEAGGLCLKTLPWSQTFLKYLRKQKAQGRHLVLCTGSTQNYAEQTAELFGLFDSVWGSFAGRRLTGAKKAAFLQKQYGYKNFDYAGNSLYDLKPARLARQFILVNPSFLTKLLFKNQPIQAVFEERKIGFKPLIYFLGLDCCLLSCVVFIPFFLKALVNTKGAALGFPPPVFGFVAAVSGWMAAWTLGVHITSLAAARITQNLNHNLIASGDVGLPTGLVLTGLGFGVGVWGLFQELGLNAAAMGGVYFLHLLLIKNPHGLKWLKGLRRYFFPCIILFLYGVWLAFVRRGF